MNNTQIYHRIEILFWKAAVALIHDTKRLRSTLILGVTIIANMMLYILLVVAVFSLHDNKSLSYIFVSNQAREGNQTASIYPMQHNTLLILVDDLHTKSPQLDGLWLVISQGETLKTFLIPIFPAINEGKASLEMEYATSFSLDADGNPRRVFVEMLESKGIWWETRLVIDRSGLLRMIEKLGEKPSIRWALKGGSVGEQNSVGSDELVSTLTAQIEILDLLCRRSQSVIQMVRSDATPSMYVGHVISNLSSEQAITAQQRLLVSGGGLSCEFPTFSGYIARNND